MVVLERVRAELSAVVAGSERGVPAADRLCAACVALLGVDGAAITLLQDGVIQGTCGSSNDASRRMDEFQFTFGEGPCLESFLQRSVVLVADLAAPEERRWPVFAGALTAGGVRAVFALPIWAAGLQVGALDLFRQRPGALDDDTLGGALVAAEIAAVPLLDLLTGELDGTDAGDGHGELQPLASLARVEVYQATGMLMAGLQVGAAEALVRLRGYAFAHDLSASEVAWKIVDRQLRLDVDDSWHGPASHGEPS